MAADNRAETKIIKQRLRIPVISDSDLFPIFLITAIIRRIAVSIDTSNGQ